jgi:hypothetical protein
MPYPFTFRRMGSLSLFWRRTTIHQHLPPRDAIAVVEHDETNHFTYDERRLMSETMAVVRGLEAQHNRRVAWGLRRLGRKRPRLVLAFAENLDATYAAAEAEAELASFDAHFRHDGVLARKPRRISSRARWAALIVLSVVDVAAYRAAVEMAFDTPGDLMGRVESSLLALLSLGMVLCAKTAAEQVRHLIDARSAAETGLASSLTYSRSHLDEFRWIGVPAIVGAFLLLLAGSVLRIQALDPRPTWMYLVVPLFSSGALLGAFFIEQKWASAVGDRRDGLARVARCAVRRRRRTSRRAGRRERSYVVRQTRITMLWSRFAPAVQQQYDLAARSISQARANNPLYFHPLGPDVGELAISEMRAHPSTRTVAHGQLDQGRLALDGLAEEARIEFAERHRAAARITLPPPSQGVRRGN